MSLISSFIIDPVVRAGRRFSGAGAGAGAAPVPPAGDAAGRLPLSHANQDPSSATAPPTDGDADADAGAGAGAGADATAARDAPQTASARPVPLLARFRSYSSFTRRPQHVAGGEEMGDGRDAITTTATAPMDVPVDAASMSSNPSHALQQRFRRLDLDLDLDPDPLGSSAPAAPTAIHGAAPGTAAMSESLPADDGFAHLRARIHDIRALKITEQERAQMIHGLMTERYNHMRPTSPSSFVSHDRPFTPNSAHSVFSEARASSPLSAASDVDVDNPYKLRPGDTSPTYRTLKHNDDEEDDEDHTDEELVLGCQHYKRNVKVQCHECRHWYTCRHCHDEVEDHALNRKATQNMLCMACSTPQKASDTCKECGTEAACYYCDLCKLRGEGLGKDYTHCQRCNVCITISHADSHVCIPRATDSGCPICTDYLFTSSAAVVSMPCGHYMHKQCYTLYMETAYKCPICKKSAVKMDLQWRKLTSAIEGQPMPEQFANTRAVVQCNDCSRKSSVKYHWLGNQCENCDSYNTNELRILNGPESEEAANALLDADASSGTRSPASVSSPQSQALRSPRYYFQPDEPEETWLPGQLPSFPFQMPQFPGRPRMPDMPQMPRMPGFPSLPQFPQFPNMPRIPQMPQMRRDAEEMLERFRRSMDAYLNPTGEVRDEHVPFIDLGGDDRRETTEATDGTQVKGPYLPQYYLERFSQALTRFRNELNPGMEDIPDLNLSEGQDPEGLQFWADDGGRVAQVNAKDEGDDEASDDGSSSDESNHEEEDDEDEDEDDNEHNGQNRKTDWDLPGHL
ncbi:structural constituent of ribosome [Ascochyta rabiei]|uniref:Structural constituent of ribosome n=1 Tax=Didymella rabiei TaxID=5454 RepID=A0A162YIS0_DIDRA|nr:structural constituent of ribosome [Ascochyta rabiei]